uniref:Uncharacterized protein n=1 Tax=Vitis vinifera TaxID=29760 RepID=F6H4N6_VITVI
MVRKYHIIASLQVCRCCLWEGRRIRSDDDSILGFPKIAFFGVVEAEFDFELKNP